MNPAASFTRPHGGLRGRIVLHVTCPLPAGTSEGSGTINPDLQRIGTGRILLRCRKDSRRSSHSWVGLKFLSLKKWHGFSQGSDIEPRFLLLQGASSRE